MHLDREAGRPRSDLGEGLLSEGISLTAPEAAPPDPAPLFADAQLERGRDGGLRLGGVSLEAIARDVGTPVFVYNAAVITERFRTLSAAFADLPHEIHYAVKANSNLAVLGLLHRLGAGADIVSTGEMRRALRAGIQPGAIVFSGVGKTEAELEAAVGARIGSINVESAEELTAIERIVSKRSTEFPVRIGIRVNPEVSAETHPYITTGTRGIKFGIPGEQVAGLARRIAANPRLTLVTLAMHLGSQLLDPEPFARGARTLGELVDRLRDAGVRTLEAIDLGGGLGIRYRDESPLEPAALASAVRPILADRGLRLHLEPGRYLTGSAGVLVVKVLYRKRSGGKDFVIVDGSMTELMRPSHYQAYHAIVEVAGRPRSGSVVDVVGPVCETGDFLALERPLAQVEPGEFLAVLCAGAYGAAMSSNYNSRPRAPEILIERGRYAVIRRRETIEDLYRGETTDPFTQPS